MNDRKPILFGGALLTLVVVAVGAIWFFGNQGTSTASPADAVGQSDFLSSGEPTGDPARTPIPLDHDEPIAMTVYLSPTCGCCGLWVEHIEEYGFETELEYRTDMFEVKEAFQVRPELSSCHTAVVNGYVIEGHVPGDVVREFLAEAPEARGLAAPGMPIGSPGMETDGPGDAYDVVAFTSDGRSQVYSEQGRD